MKIDPVPLEKMLRAETVSRSLHTLSRKELEHYTAQLISLTTRLTHYTTSLKRMVAELELGVLPPEGKF
jgi:hypothetical protein